MLEADVFPFVYSVTVVARDERWQEHPRGIACIVKTGGEGSLRHELQTLGWSMADLG